MSKNEQRKKTEEKLNIKDIHLTKKFPFLGFSPSLIDYFLIIGYDIPSKSEIVSNFLKDTNKNIITIPQENMETLPLNTMREEPQQEKEILPSQGFNTEYKPVVLNSIGSDFTNAALDEELIIKLMFPNNNTLLYCEKIEKTEKVERTDKAEKTEKVEPPSQNIILYLKANKIYEFDDAHNEMDEKLKNEIMFNVFGYLFWEALITEGKDQQKYKIFFPKMFVFISQFSCFKYFSFLSQNIHAKIKYVIPFEIPLEVQLYNIINFSPSPINSNLCFDVLINDDLIDLKKKYTRKNDEIIKIKKVNDNKEYKNNDKIIFISQLTGFPYLDINLTSIFLYYNLDLFIIIYLFSFLEFKCLFFSPHLDRLNNIMYVLNILSYPFINLTEEGQIYTVSKEEILDKYKIKTNYITGVNCAFDIDIGKNLPEIYNDYFIINLGIQKENDTPDITIYYKGNNMNKYDSKSDVSKLYHNLKKFLNEEPTKNDNYLETKLNVLLNNIHQNFLKYCSMMESDTDTVEKNKKEMFFKEINFADKQTGNIYKYSEFEESNLTFQKTFYLFNISVLEYFHDMVVLEVSNKPENKLKDDKIKAYYEINFKNKEDIDYKESSKFSYKFNEFDKIFLKFFRKTKKFEDFIEKFIKHNNCQEIKRQVLLISEEFMNLNKVYLYDETRDYFQIISKFYQTSNKLRKINFNKFYNYFSENLLRTFYDYVRDSKVLKIKDPENKVKAKSTSNTNLGFLEKENVLDNNFLLRYSYLLNNMEPKQLNELFPHLDFKIKGNILEEIGQNLFADFLESHLIDAKIYNLKEVVSFIILIIYIISLKKNKLLFHFFEEIMKNKLIEQRCCLRKYIYFILYLLNEKVKEKIKLKKNYIRELLIYKEIMSCIYSLNQKNTLNGYYPNGLLSDVIRNFNFYQNYYDGLLKEYPIIAEKNKIVFEKYNNYTSEILEDGLDYKVFMQNNACEDKGAIKDDVLIGITEALEYKGVIQTTCKSCKFKIKPNLFFIHVPNDRSNAIGFYSLIYSYKNALKILKKNFDTNDKGSFDEDYFNLCGNMIFYINFREKNPILPKEGVKEGANPNTNVSTNTTITASNSNKNSLLSRFIATSLV